MANTTQKRLNPRNLNLAKIHIAKAQLEMDDHSYRSLLARIAGVRSASELTPRQAENVLAEFRRLGWLPTTTGQNRQRPQVAADRQTVLGKIEALLSEARRPWEYAETMADRMFHRKRLEWLEPTELQRLMQALIIDAQRNGRA